MQKINPHYEVVKSKLLSEAKTWLVTGVAGFIGSHLLETLLKLNQTVVGLDNYATGHKKNLEEVRSIVSSDQWGRFTFIEGDIRDIDVCKQACVGIDFVLHQAALGSVPRSIEDPINTHSVNLTGFLNIISAAKDAQVKGFVYAASSSTYGDSRALPKTEDVIGKPLSPYAVTKYANELYAEVFFKCYGFKSVGLRYFNVFGPRQDPGGPYAAVIPKWIDALINERDLIINGDGQTSRDFCYVANAVQANLLAVTFGDLAQNEIINIACGGRTTLNELTHLMQSSVADTLTKINFLPIINRDFRKGDVLHSQADISKAKKLLQYSPTHLIHDGIEETVRWYISA